MKNNLTALMLSFLIMTCQFTVQAVEDSTSLSAMTTETLVNDLFSKGLYEKAIKILQKEKEKPGAYCCEGALTVTIMELNKQIKDLKTKALWSEAIKKYEQVLKAHPDSYQSIGYALTGIAKIWREQEKYDEALNIYNQLLTISRRQKGFYNEGGISVARLCEVESRWEIAECQTDKGCYDKAIKEYELMIQLATDPESYSKYSIELKAETLETVGQWRARIKELRELQKEIN